MLGRIFRSGVLIPALIIVAGLKSRGAAGERAVGAADAGWMGAVQGLCLPFRGLDGTVMDLWTFDRAEERELGECIQAETGKPWKNAVAEVAS